MRQNPLEGKGGPTAKRTFPEDYNDSRLEFPSVTPGSRKNARPLGRKAPRRPPLG